MFNDYDFHVRKKERTEYYYRFIYRWKLVKCIACNGSGYYDDTGSPPCSSCDGIGKCRVSSKQYKEYMEFRRKYEI